MKSFSHVPIFDNVYCPKKPVALNIDKDHIIRLTLIDYIDLNESTGEFYVRNLFTGSIMILSQSGDKLRMSQKRLIEFLKDNERFEKTKNTATKRAKEAEDERYEGDPEVRTKRAFG